MFQACPSGRRPQTPDYISQLPPDPLGGAGRKEEHGGFSSEAVAPATPDKWWTMNQSERSMVLWSQWPLYCAVCFERRFLFSPPSSLVIPNPVTAAVHTMGNPIMTQLCVEIKTHVGHEEERYLSELKGDRLCCCAFTGDG